MEKKNIIIFSIIGIAIIIVIILLFVVNPFSADPPAIPQSTIIEQPEQDSLMTDAQAQTNSESKTDSKTNAPKKKQIADNEYVVKEGETLRAIAKDVYGDEKKWFKIFIANESRIDWYDTIYVGQKLVLPN